jgi:hypothetical protein
MQHIRIVSILLALCASALAQVPPPSQALGFEVGADRTLADYRQIASYFALLDQKSPRVSVVDLGPTTLGEPMIMAVISSEKNMAALPRIREVARRLADPRGLKADEVDALVREGRTIVLVTCNIHATEIASSQMAMEWAHSLATATDEATLRRLDQVVLLLVPSLNPDGQIMEVEWYRKHLRTPLEGGRLPWLYHPYVGHDNNRDWFMLTQSETRNMSRAIYHEWFPQLFVDLHQMGSAGPRMFIPPFADPADPDVHPLIWREVNLIGSNMALRLEQAGKAGVIYGYQFDAYWVGGTRNTGWWKNVTGLLLEIASARMATPLFIEPSELAGSGKGLVEYRSTVNHPNPWKGGWWRLRDIMDYGRIAADALFEIAAERREDFLRNVYARSRDAIASAAPGEAYLIPATQHDPATARKLAELMADHNVEVLTDGSAFWIPLAQPYNKFIVEMLEKQRYPEVRPVRGSEILRPYDVATWTLPLAMGVRVEKSTIPADARLTRVVAPITLGGHYAVVPEHKSAARVGIYKPWNASMDEGWTRWVLERNGFDIKTIDNASMRSAKLRDRFDAIILPDLDPDMIATGKAKRADGEMLYVAELPPQYRGGLDDGSGRKGSENLRDFVKAGGTLIAFDSSANYVIENFNIPVRNVLATAKATDFEVPGSLVRIKIRTDHPITQGMPAETAAFLDDHTAFETTVPGAEIQRWVLASYPEHADEILLSGWIHGEEKLTRRAALVATTWGSGKIVLFGFRPQHRGQTYATFPLLFNAIEWSLAKP